MRVFLLVLAIPALLFAASPSGFVIWSEGGHQSRTLKYVEIREGVGPVASTKQTAVVRGTYADIQCVISNDGRWVAFARQVGEGNRGLTDDPGDYHYFGNYDVYYARIDGTLPATATKVGRGYWPSWGDDSDGPTKTLYYSWCSGTHGGELRVMKTVVNEQGQCSTPTIQIQGWGTSGDAHMQPAPDGRKVAWRPGGVNVYDASVTRDVGAGGGCHPSWAPDSYWLMWAHRSVGAFDNGQKLWSGTSGLHEYHFGFSNDMKWVIGRIGSSGNDQNTDYPIIYYPLAASRKGEPVSWNVNTGQGTTVGNGTWCDIHVSVGPDLRISSAAASISLSQQVQISASLLNGATGTINWQLSGGGALSATSNTGATFTSNGTAGSFTITATLGELVRTVSIRVIDPSAIDIKINCGGATVGEWESDAAYASGGTSHNFSTTINTSGVDDAPPAEVCPTVRHQNHKYAFTDLPNGNYMVTMYFTDAHGGRNMRYTIEGVTVLDNFDPLTAAGGANKLVAREFDVAVADGNGLQIDCSVGSGNDVFEAALRIQATGSSSTATAPLLTLANPKVRGYAATRTSGGWSIAVDLQEAYTVEVLSPEGRLISRFGAAGPQQFVLLDAHLPPATVVRLRSSSGVSAGTLLHP